MTHEQATIGIWCTLCGRKYLNWCMPFGPYSHWSVCYAWQWMLALPIVNLHPSSLTMQVLFTNLWSESQFSPGGSVPCDNPGNAEGCCLPDGRGLGGVEDLLSLISIFIIWGVCHKNVSFKDGFGGPQTGTANPFFTVVWTRQSFF